MTTTDRARLLALAKAATPGPWRYEPIYESMRGAPDYAHIHTDAHSVPLAYIDHSEHDAEYVAAANPATIITLLSALEEAERCIHEIADAETHQGESDDGVVWYHCGIDQQDVARRYLDSATKETT